MDFQGHPDSTSNDFENRSTVETPSRLMLFCPNTTPPTLTALLPTQPLSKPLGHPVTLGRSGSADVHLNDESMSRLYAALWHDGVDPFVFRVRNLSQRKLLLVDGAQLRYQDEAEVKDGSELTLDLLKLRARVCGGDYVTSHYEVHFVKNVAFPSSLPSSSRGDDWSGSMPFRIPGPSLSPAILSMKKQRNVSVGQDLSDVLVKQLSPRPSLLQGAGLEGGEENYYNRGALRSQSSPGDLGVAECDGVGEDGGEGGGISSRRGEEGASTSSGLSGALTSPFDYPILTGLNIPIYPRSPTPHGQAALKATASPQHSGGRYSLPEDRVRQQGHPAELEQRPSRFSPNAGPHDEKLASSSSSNPPILDVIAQRVQDALMVKSSKAEGPPACSDCQRQGLSDLVRVGERELASGRYPEESSADWDTDDPNINCYME